MFCGLAVIEDAVSGVIRRDASHLGTRMVLVYCFSPTSFFFFLTPDADLHLAQPPLPSMPDFVSMEHKTGFRAMLRVQFVMQPTSTIAKQSHLRSWYVKLVVIQLENGK